MRTVYRETYKAGRGFTDEEFERACSEASRGSTDEIFMRHVRGAQEIDFGRFLGYAGLTLQPRSSPEVPEGFLGLKVRSNQGLTVASRLFGSPAEAADMSAGDEIIAVDGLRMDGQRLPFYIANQKPGTEVSVVSAREGILRETKVRSRLQGPRSSSGSRRKRPPAPEEKAVFRSWALSDWDAATGVPGAPRLPGQGQKARLRLTRSGSVGRKRVLDEVPADGREELDESGVSAPGRS